jgi:chemotaxis protein CheY-P-specific phosphatase CheC
MINTELLLTEALSIALEKMAFLTIGPVEEEMMPPQDTLLSEIHFAGPESGTIRILAGIDFVRLLADNMSAGQDTDTEACLDVFRELSNVTCGLMLPVLSRSQEDIFDITVPNVVGSEKTPAWNEFTIDQNCTILNVENNMVAIKLIRPQQTKK